MHSLKILTLPIWAAGAAFLCGPSIAQARPLPLLPSSFLRQPVTTVAQLTNEVRQDSIVRQRFADHFHLKPAALMTFIAQDLQTAPLRSAQTEQIFLMGPHETQYASTVTLPKGTEVFVRKQDGSPVLRLDGGNPIRTISTAPKPLAAVAASGAASAGHGTVFLALSALGVGAGLLASHGSSSSGGSAPLSLSALVQPASPSSLSAHTPSLVEKMPSTVTAQGSGTTTFVSPSPSQPIGAVGKGLGAPGSLTSQPNSVSPVPEPSPLLAYMMGCGLLVFCAALRQYKHRRVS